MNENLKIEECKNDKEWNDFIIKTENKNIYSTSEFINYSSVNKKKFYIKKNEEILGSFHVNYSKKKILKGETIYSPINFKKFEKKNKSSDIYKKFNVIKTFVDFITKNFSNGNFILDSHVQDLRPFYWYNFDNNKTIFKVEDTRYTSILEIKENFKNPNINELLKSDLFKNFSRSIKQQLKSPLNKDFIFQENFNLESAFEILNKTFKRQKKKIDYNLKKLKKIYLDLYSRKQLKIFYTIENNENIAFSIFSKINDKAIYLNGGRLKNLNTDYSLTFNLAHSLMRLRIEGVNIIDLEGVNSPNRGFWKLGFGGNLLPYYHISMNK